MFERFRLSNLSRNFRLRGGSSELARDKKNQQQRQQCVTVLFLDDITHTFRLEKRAKGSELLDQVFQYLELSERDYFGLLFPQKPGDVVRWVDAQKQFKKQCSSVSLDNDAVPLLEFRVKFFVSDPSRLQEEFTRYQFYLQIKRNILLGKLPCSSNTQCLLASYTVQSELGDFNAAEHQVGYLSGLQLLSEQTPEAERKVSELHKLHRGQLPADAEYNYLEHGKRLELYGIDLHKATDSSGKDLQLGVSAVGLLVFQHALRVNTFSWSKMVKVSFKRKDFFIQLRREPSENYDTLLGFGMISHKHAKALWKSCVEHHSFFRLKRPHRLSRFLNISLGSKFYYSGRTELQAVQESKQRGRIHKVFVRSPSKRLLAGGGGGGAGATSSSGGTPLLHSGGSGGSESAASQHNGKPSASTILTITKTSRPHDNKVTSKEADSMPRKAWEQQSDEYDIQLDVGFIEQCSRRFESPSPMPPAYSSGQHSPLLLPTTIADAVGGQPDSGSDLITIRLQADDQGRYGFNVKGGVDLSLPVQVSKVVPHTPADRCTPRVCEGDEVLMINGRDVHGLRHEQVVSMIRDCRHQSSGELLLTVRPQRSAPLLMEEEPLYQYVPESDEIGSHSNLLDGDALFTQSLLLLSDGLASGALLAQYEVMYRKNPDLAITEARKAANAAKNRYRDISPYDCTRVSLVNSLTGDYINANYVNMEIPGGAVNRYIATQGPLASTTTDFWRMVQQESSHLLVMLTTVMEAGRQKCHQYWPVTGEELQLADGFSVRCLSEKPDETGSFVFREFVLKDKHEQRHIHHMQYLAWPDHCVPSDPNLFLEFTERVRAARNRTLLQEIEESLKQVRLMDADAGDDENGGLMRERKCAASNGATPEDETPVSTSVHQCISAANPPVIVHCSAGIGRTGVLILMDTALALMESREPVYPLDIVRTMRDQRACMVQNVSQYRFVCECICAAYMKMSRSSAAIHDDDD
ncbi:tyrosine-protein phosphatase non-receptor type 4 [Drosophila pseudoobscura]|uniref:Tyrosine-protein phosphatase n=1 Tax=Drosophila pseudoobscura pseudoobscura TaxID=46245 RepID=A0A6I8UAN5_DROPS|nr:tyrosine-protein phosphatase non-receptor type 4 [Drosophila pseudoobscura]XP_033240584.1 tyrosine-protein phosphatase non-receptor type 4 [Drosophila pseudoobscura]XP_033240585.1 tyrosine-protein phosphatase non-receptor type 4 [Drosophila pseudoobscura]XP_033240586.1 tyrosine-protein phosphatase non-receptor type 4 [Drosophila pseudoobscura]XP_033240587.1 tyrosine-protein phosphatase non-receptor type 4 [Drosophila pseudoobscura]XP_033240588.1 tyrosine-protein phosphatase non-receptor typ